MAEGYRKLAMLIFLLRYGVLERGSTLFWDEPEANLEPRSNSSCWPRLCMRWRVRWGAGDRGDAQPVCAA
jgi:hypothetical protein